MELQQGEGSSKWTMHSNHNIKCFTESEIETITNNYRTMLGRGAFGEVYRGVLEDKSVVAVKRLIHSVRENFDKELTIHREINHRNVVRLIGYCVGENASVMVTEYIPNGNLSDILHGGNIPISLEIRLRIATECAEALAYMHSYMYTQVIHGDIKPGNILLDGNLKAKISDFGISRLVNNPDTTMFTENVMGSIGYMDPLFAQDGQLTVKSDVYSFGVVLVELITRKKAITSGGEPNIVWLITNALANGIRGVRQMFDAEIASQNNMKILEGLAKLAGECLRMERGSRPDMIDVVERLRRIGKASHEGQVRLDFFSWVRKRNPTPPALVTIHKNTSPSEVYRRFSFKEMKAATRNFDDSFRVHDDIFGFYCGLIDGGATKVAIQRPDSLLLHHFGICDYYRTAIEEMSKLSHRHIVPMIGHCDENGERILVHGTMARGSLYEHLYMIKEPRLTWTQRLEICTGVARGLHYLHRGDENHAIIHGSLKPKNIFLDENWIAKIIYPFLLSSRNYTDLTEQSDVYDFGVILFEVLSAQVGRILPTKYMLTWALRYKEEGRLHLFYEPSLEGKINIQSLNKFTETAAKCITDQGIDRPSMEGVLLDLECALQLQVNGELSGSSS